MLSATVFYLFTGYTWMRSGHGFNAYTALYLTASGVRDGAYPARLLAVRPALYKKGFSLADEDGFLKTTDIRCFAVRDKQTYSNTFACPKPRFSLPRLRQLREAVMRGFINLPSSVLT